MEQKHLFEKPKGVKVIVSAKDHPTAYNNLMEQMKANLNTEGRPKVGIFWYSAARNELFGVQSFDYQDTVHCSGSPLGFSCRLLHRDYWKKQYNKLKFKNDGHTFPFIGDYKDSLRGRVFYIEAENKFRIAVGDWIREGDNADCIDLIVDEFNLEKEDYEFFEGRHWNKGEGWENS